MDREEAEVLFSLRNISKVFPSGKTALDAIDLDIYRGECLLIAGSNGSGKTILTRILTGLTDASSGTVLFKGSPLGKNIRALRSFAGIVFQDADAQILGETVAEDTAFGPENLGLKGRELDERVALALSATGLSGKEDYPPRSLSGGEKRRLAVAGVLAMGCEMLVMDEPFANLDYDGVLDVLRIIKDFKEKGKTLVVLTHELEKVLALADRLVILNQGRIRDSGVPALVLDRLEGAFGIRDPRYNYQNIEDCTWLKE